MPILIAATLTPFDGAGGLDLDRLQAHVRWMCARGVGGFGPTGTTGEFLYLSNDERAAVHRAVIDAAGDRPVVPCVWDGSPGGTVGLARAAERAGATAVFLPPPLYQPVCADAIRRWYGQVVDAVGIPVWAYHHPRTHNPLDEDLLDDLFTRVGVVAMKDSSGDATRVRGLASRFPGRVYVGGDHLVGESLGPIAGYISRYANLRPSLCAGLLRGGEGQADRVRRRSQMLETGSSAGGLPAIKLRLGMGLRLPVLLPPGGDPLRIPPTDFQG